MPQTNPEERMAKVEGILEQMAERLNHIETEQISLREGQEGLRKQVRSEIRSLYNLIIIMWVTIIFSFGGLFATIVFK